MSQAPPPPLPVVLGGKGVRPNSGELDEGGILGRLILFNTANHQQLLDCNPFTGTQLQKEAVRKHDANWRGKSRRGGGGGCL